MVEITKKDRTGRVKDDNYGVIQGYGLEKYDTPVFESDEELFEFLEYNFIPKFVKMNIRKFGKNIEEGKKPFPVISLANILRLKLSELETKKTIEYINNERIRVTGISSDYDSEFESYDYVINYDSSIANYVKMMYGKDISPVENLEKFKEYIETKDPKIREELILRNYKLVPLYVFKLATRYNIDIKDAQGYGYEGLIYAVDHYDPDKGTLFSTYAIICIQSSVKNHVAEEQRDLYPNSDIYFRFRNIRYVVERKWGKSFYEEPAMIDDLIELFMEEYKYPQHRKNEFYRIFAKSIEDLSEKELQSESFFEEYDFEESLFNEEQTKLINRILKENLNEREILVLEHKFGLNGKEQKNFVQMAILLGISKTRVSQIFNDAIKKLKRLYTRKHSDYIEMLSYWNTYANVEPDKPKHQFRW